MAIPAERERCDGCGSPDRLYRVHAWPVGGGEVTVLGVLCKPHLDEFGEWVLGLQPAPGRAGEGR